MTRAKLITLIISLENVLNHLCETVPVPRVHDSTAACRHSFIKLLRALCGNLNHLWICCSCDANEKNAIVQSLLMVKIHYLGTMFNTYKFHICKFGTVN